MKGIKIGTDGVATRKGLLAFNQSFVPYLADERILGIAEALFGPHVRISFTTAHINLPGNARGGWHADWPFNQNNAGHIPAPYPDVVMHLTTIKRPNRECDRDPHGCSRRSQPKRALP